MTIFRSKWVAVFALTLASCSDRAVERSLVCDNIPGWIDESAVDGPDDQLVIVQQCIHKFGARFALAAGSNSEISRATVTRCKSAIEKYSSLIGSEDTQAAMEKGSHLEKDFFDLALMRVVQQRAGNCPFPKAGK